MAISDFAFSPATGLEDTNTYPSTPATEAAFRADVMSPMNQVKTYLNNTIKPAVEGKIDSTETDTWHLPASFLNSWLNFGGSNACGYKKDNLGYVHLRGMVKSGTIGQAAFALPSGYRPEQTIQAATVANDAFAQAMLTAAGNVVPMTGSNTWFSLDTIPPFKGV